jgi:hypothetical protein
MRFDHRSPTTETLRHKHARTSAVRAATPSTRVATPGIMIGMRFMSRALLTAAALFASLPAADAHACSAPACSPAALFPTGGSIPTDRVRISYHPSLSYPADPSGDASVMLPRMYMLDGSTKVAVPFELLPDGAQGLWLKPVVNPPIGAQLVVETDAAGCSLDAALSVTYSITEARALPTTLGTLQSTVKRALLPVATDNGACSESADVSYADLSISLSNQAQPFAALLRYQLYVDGKPRESFVDGRQRVYARCGEIDGGSRGGLEPGRHVVHFRAQVGDELPLQTPDLQLELLCEGFAPTHPVDAGLGTQSEKLSGSCALDQRAHASWMVLLLLGLLARARVRAF